MNTLLLIITAISTVSACAVSAFHLWLDWKKWKEPKKDEIWETVTRLMCAGKDDEKADEETFEEFYIKLKAFKESGYATPENRLDPDSPRVKK